MIYFAFLLLLCLISLRLPSKMQTYASVFILILMMLLCGLRGDYVGRDTINYVQFTDGLVEEDRFGISYTIIRDLLLFYGLDAHEILLFFAIITYLPIIILVYKLTNKPALAVLLYMTATSHFFLETFNLVRQELAVSFIILSIYCFSRNEKKGYFLSLVFYILALLSHSISVIVLPGFIICKRKFSKLTVTAGVFISIALGYIGADKLLTSAIELLGFITIIDGSYLTNYGEHVNNVSWSFLGTITHWLPLALLCLGSYSKKSDNVLYNFLWIGTMMTNLLISNKFCDRIASLFTISMILYIPLVYKSLLPNNKVLVQTAVFIFCFLHIYGLLSLVIHPEARSVIPYHFYFE